MEIKDDRSDLERGEDEVNPTPTRRKRSAGIKIYKYI